MVIDNLEISAIVADIYDRIQSKQVRLPSPPDIYFKVLEASQDGDIKDIERIIQYDASITARLIQVANSSALAGSFKSRTLFDALRRLGTKLTGTLILGLSLRDRFSLHCLELREEARSSWGHSVRVGVGSSILVQELDFGTKFSKELALTAGLLHGVGKLPIIDYFSDNLNKLEYFPQVLRSLHAEIGARIISSWGLPEELVQCTRVDPLLSEATATTPVTYADIVALVSALNKRDETGFISSYEKKVGVTLEGIAHVLEVYTSEIEELVSSLGVG